MNLQGMVNMSMDNTDTYITEGEGANRSLPANMKEIAALSAAMMVVGNIIKSGDLISLSQQIARSLQKTKSRIYGGEENLNSKSGASVISHGKTTKIRDLQNRSEKEIREITGIPYEAYRVIMDSFENGKMLNEKGKEYFEEMKRNLKKNKAN